MKKMRKKIQNQTKIAYLRDNEENYPYLLFVTKKKKLNRSIIILKIEKKDIDFRFCLCNLSC